ncbi:acetolactate synthase-1/2/3 large subunit [Clostridium punense]|uniref:Acetolactate synthase-1/2/3 large subunit n=1 Tax=Clostridium punense TaxID=1054297 RepID=A0ABS4K6X9_9CLOT|nr:MULTISPECIES: thiamine pyrophosphate-binding protein [Clostridium]EQB88335.1 hypothetical protein M918_04715 [Clostridium sp. BL8]MBP2023529.1 acetolactate synthase-1/2/3 large subunit [Clostridium punense]
MRISDVIVRKLVENEVEYVFGISAGTVSSLFDAINDSEIKVITTKNEAGAAYAASKYASMSEKMGVCIVAGGVGINNMINGIADAMRTKVPVLILSGYVHRWQVGKGAIQELNTENIVSPITKYSKTIFNENEFFEELDKAMKIAKTPPYGPVHLSIPIDMQMLKVNSEFDNFNNSDNEFQSETLAEVAATVMTSDFSTEIDYDFHSLINATRIINEEEKGLIFVGRGCRLIGEEVKKLAEHLNWPIITTPEAKGVINTEFKYNLGNYGFSSTDAAVNFVENEKYSCLLVLGSSLGESATRNYNDVLFKGKKLIHIDWDKKELDKVYKFDVSVFYDLKEAIPYIIKNTSKKDNKFIKPDKINDQYSNNHNGLSLRLFLEEIVNIVPQNTYFVSDIGEYMNFLFKYLPIKEHMGFDISLNYGAMGSGVCGAIGSHLALKDRQIAVFVGDGSFFMNGTEILTAKHYNMPIIYFVINNSMLGYVEHGHQYLYGRTVTKSFVYDRVSIADIAKAMNIKSIQINNIEEVKLLNEFVADLNEPCIVELITDGSEKVPVADRFKALNNSQ